MKTGIIADYDIFRFFPYSTDQKSQITHKLHIQGLFSDIHLMKPKLCLNLAENIKADLAGIFCIEEMHGIFRFQAANTLKPLFMHIFKIYEKNLLGNRLRLCGTFQKYTLQIRIIRGL